jgi:hypothetical protein
MAKWLAFLSHTWDVLNLSTEAGDRNLSFTQFLLANDGRVQRNIRIRFPWGAMDLNNDANRQIK